MEPESPESNPAGASPSNFKSGFHEEIQQTPPSPTLKSSPMPTMTSTSWFQFNSPFTFQSKSQLPIPSTPRTSRSIAPAFGRGKNGAKRPHILFGKGSSPSSPSCSTSSSNKCTTGDSSEVGSPDSVSATTSGSSMSTGSSLAMPRRLEEYNRHIHHMVTKTLEQTLPCLFQSCTDMVREMDQELPRKLNKAKNRGDGHIVRPEQIQSLRPEPVSTGSLYCSDEGSTNRYYDGQDIGPIISQSGKSQYSDTQTLIAPEVHNLVNEVYSSTLQEEPATESRGGKRKREEGKLEQQPQDVLLQPTENVPIQLMKRQRACSSENVDAVAPPPPPPTPVTPPRCCTLSSSTVESVSTAPVDVNQPPMSFVGQLSINDIARRGSRISCWNNDMCNHIYYMLECIAHIKLMLQQNEAPPVPSRSSLKSFASSPSRSPSLRTPSTSYSSSQRSSETTYISEELSRSFIYHRTAQLQPATRSKMMGELDSLTNGGNSILSAIERYHVTRFELLFKMEGRQAIRCQRYGAASVNESGDMSRGSSQKLLDDSCMRELERRLELLDERQQSRLWLWAREMRSSSAGLYRLLQTVIRVH